MSEKEIYKQRLASRSFQNVDCIETDYSGSPGNKYRHIKFRGRPQGTHRVSWIIHNGEIPEGRWVLHKCDNARCHKIEHLFLGSALDNSKDMQGKGRDNYLGAKKHSDEIVEKCISFRKDGFSYKEMSKILSISQFTIQSIIRAAAKRGDESLNYCHRKHSDETIEKARTLKLSGCKYKEISEILGISKRSLTRFLKTQLEEKE